MTSNRSATPHLPTEMHHLVMDNLSPPDLLNYALTNKSAYRAARSLAVSPENFSQDNLEQAIGANNYLAVNALVSRNKPERSPFYRSRKHKMNKTLLDHGLIPDWTDVLRFSSEGDHDSFDRALRQYPASLLTEHTAQKYLASRHMTPDLAIIVVDHLPQPLDPSYLCSDLIRDGRVDVMRRLMEERKIPITTSMLMDVMFRSHSKTEMLLLLLSRATAEAINGTVGYYKRVSVLWMAVDTDDVPCARILLDHGADVHFRVHEEHNNTLLHYAKSGTMVDLLVERGLGVNSRNDRRETPLRTARSESVVKALIRHGAENP